MKLFQRLTALIFVLTAVAFAATEIHSQVLADRTPPVISFDSDLLEVSVTASEDALLEGVSAMDDTDGDLTSQVMIQGSTQLLTEDTVNVSYIVFDSANNITTASRTVRYLDYEEPTFSLSKPLVYGLRDSLKILDRLHAHDVKDGNISENIRVSTQEVSLYEAGAQNITAQVINNLGDQELLPLKIVILNTQEVFPTFELSEYIVYLDQGNYYNPKRYIQNALDSNSIQIEGSVDTKTPGTYHVCYSHTFLPDPRWPDDYYTYTVYQTVVVR